MAQEKNWRAIEIEGGTSVQSSLFTENAVSSARYSWITLIPKNLFEQFQRSAYIWFLIVSVFQLVPFHFNHTDFWSTITPLLILLLMTIVKDAYNDYNRRKEDSTVNALEYLFWNGSTFERIKCKDIMVGEIILVENLQFIPSDMILLASGNEDGTCYVDNSRIVGESNLRERKALSFTHSKVVYMDMYEQFLRRFNADIKAEPPNINFSSFKVKIKLEGHPAANDLIVENALYRGGILHGAPWVLGMVVYAGNETKTQLNTQHTHKKQVWLKR